MATTTNYGWDTPDDTDLVKDGASAIRTLGSSVDTTVKNLNPETTLGDISYRSSTANTNTRLAIGTTGQILTVSGGVPAWETPASGAPASASATVTAEQSTTSGTYTDLTTSGPAVTLTTGTKALIIITARLQQENLNRNAYASYAVSGATTISANDDVALALLSGGGGDYMRARNSAASRLSTLTAGSNTFTMKYKSGNAGSSVAFAQREIIVIDLGS